MSDSELSDNLEFESADEGQVGEEGELSDLDLDEILNEDDDKQRAVKSKPLPELAKTKEKDLTKSGTNVDDDKKKPPSSPKSETEGKKDLVVDEKKQKELERKPEKKDSVNFEKEAEKNAWDDSKLSDIDDDDSNVSGVDREKMSADVLKNLESVKIEEKPTKEEKDCKKEPEMNNLENKSSDWDDSRFSDIDDNDDVKDDSVVKQAATAAAAAAAAVASQITKSSPKPSSTIENPSLSSQVPVQSKQQQLTSTSWSWSKLGMNLISSAANLTSQVLETVETSLGAPDPTELATKIAKSKSEYQVSEGEEKQKLNLSAAAQSKDDANWNFDNENNEWFTINKITSTGTSLVSGSLDVLESVGKKTFEIINDKDPNFKQTKQLLKKMPVSITSKPNLSQLLREAQSQNKSDEQANVNCQQKSNKSSVVVVRKEKQEKMNFGLFFDEYKGTAHLEALEMLSSQASVKIEMLLIEKPMSKFSSSVRSRLDEIEQQLFDTERLNEESTDDDDEIVRACHEDFKLLVSSRDDNMFNTEHFEFLITEYAKKTTNLKIMFEKVIAAFRTTSYATKEVLSPFELFNESIKCFALITSNMIELFHKAAESIFLELENSKTQTKRAAVFENIEALFKITKLSLKSVTILSDDYSRKCKANSKQFNEANPNHIITDIFLEASNSNTYIGDAFVLFLPIFKFQLLNNKD